MKKTKEEILLNLKNNGFIIDDSVLDNLSIVITDAVNELLDDELELLKEFEAIHKKKLDGAKLSFLEASFYNFISNHYKKK